HSVICSTIAAVSPATQSSTPLLLQYLPRHSSHLPRQYCKNAAFSLRRGCKNRIAAKIQHLPYGKAEIAFKMTK
ncbi:MAG: hypothetical protein E6230_28215, partial [Paenibacillus dendritiformis]|nr:hypothetical protein [Paenibacillus dendritiformis]